MKPSNIKSYVDSLLAASTPEKPAWNLEVVLGHIPPGWNYIDGCMVKAVLELYAVTGEEKYLAFADSFADAHVAADGSIPGYSPQEYSSDHVNEGKVLFDLYRRTGKKKYRKAIDTVYSQLETHPRTQSGSFWHKKIYPNQIWLDGLYMVQPFYMEYENTFNNGKNVQDSVRQFQNAYTLMRDEKTGLLYHGYDESRESVWADRQTGLSPNFWARSLGWYTMALVDTLEKMDKGLVAQAALLQGYLVAIADALLQVADPETGLFWQVPNRAGCPGNYLETSGSCAIAYALMKGARLGWLPAHVGARGEGMLQSVIREKLVAREGTLVLQDICLVAGLGGMPGRGDYRERDGSFEYYISEPRVDNDAKGVAPFLFAFAELCRRQ